jgi:peptidoglycan/xylan/chitin deacetylase (PgdA/CDA1 family)
MALAPEYLEYPHRRHAMDHERYRWSNLFDRLPLQFPGGAKVALWVTIASEFFPLDEKGKPFKAPGGMVTPYPDLRHYTSRDYGNRVGIFRLFRALERVGCPASVAMNAAVAERYPALVREATQRGHELVCHGYDMDTLHHSGLAESDERAIIARSRDVLAQASGTAPLGWWSPASAQSFATPDLLREAGFAYCCDWANDELPYRQRTRTGDLYALPLSEELSDRQIIFGYHHTEARFAQQVRDQLDWLLAEAAQTGCPRVMSLVLYPYISGQPYRIWAVEEALDYVARQPGVWATTGAGLLATLPPL